MKMKYLLQCFLLIVWSLNANAINVMDLGADPYGVELNTKVFQNAIDKASKSFDKVIVPKGRYLIGSLELKHNSHLVLEEGAILLGSTLPKDYRKLHKAGWDALILAKDVSNITIEGAGAIDGQGAELALHIDSLFYAGEIDSANYNLRLKRPKWRIRPQIIEMTNCKNVKLKGVSIRNAACWVQKYDLCEGLIIDSVLVDSDAYWNNDGIDIVDCKDVVISNCIINASDDGICIKSHFYNQANGPKLCENIEVKNCVVRSSASAIKLGTNSYGGFKNIRVKDIFVKDTYRSAIAIENVDGGVLEDILIEDVRAINTGNAIFIRLGNRKRNRGDSAQAGSLRNVTIRNLYCEVPLVHPDINYNIRGPELPFFHNVFPSSIVGIPEARVEKVRLENVMIVYPGGGNSAYANMPLDRAHTIPEKKAHYPEFSMFGELPSWGLYLRHVKGVELINVSLKAKSPDYRPAIYKEDVDFYNEENLKIWEN